MRILTLVAVTISLSACGGSSDEYADSEEEYTTSSFDEAIDEDNSTFGGYGCTDDCSGHEAGYAWAEENGIDDPDTCGGNSQSFEEGCRAYAEENGY